MFFAVTLERTLHGAAFGTTQDVIEAASVDEAVETAIRMWNAMDPTYTYRELFVTETNV